MLPKNNYKRLFVSLFTIALVSCANPWDDRENSDDINLGKNLTEAIASTPEVSQFAELLVQSGYDKILAASKSYTVFVPTNTAMAQVDDAVINDEEALKNFIENHITLTAYSSVRSGDSRIKMLNDKYLDFEGATMIDDASIVTADKYAANGVFHVIDKALTPKLNIWQYVNSQTGSSAMNDYLVSLKQFNIYQSDSIAKELSKESGAGYLADSLTNSYLKNVYNLNNEKNSYTLFLMQNDGFDSEVNKMKPYLTKTTNDPLIDSTAIYAAYFTLRDLAFAKKYKKNELPATLVSRFGVEVPIDKTQIVEEINLSNGVIYVMKKVDVPLDKRLLTKQIEGEKNDRYFNFNRARMFYRDRKDLSGLSFQDVMVQNPGAAKPIITYSAKDFLSTTYKVYWRAVNDIQANVFKQNLFIYGSSEVIDDLTTPVEKIASFENINVELNYYEDVYLGEFTLDKARDIGFIMLQGDNTTTNNNNSLTLDYLKFVPVLKLNIP